MVKFLQKKICLMIFTAFLFCVPLLSLAQEEVKIVNPLRANNFTDLVRIVLEGVIKLGIPLVALAIIYAGFLFVTSRGNPESLTKARDALLNAVIGAALLFGAWGIAQIITDTVKELSIYFTFYVV